MQLHRTGNQIYHHPSIRVHRMGNSITSSGGEGPLGVADDFEGGTASKSKTNTNEFVSNQKCLFILKPLGVESERGIAPLGEFL